MSDLTPASGHAGAIGLDHIGIAGADLTALAEAFAALGFHLTPYAAHASGRTANRCAMLRDGGYLELMATVPGRSSATLDRFLARGPGAHVGAHVLALEVGDEAAAVDRLHRAGVACEASVTERDTGEPTGGARARFALIMPPDPPEGRVLLIRQLTRELLWRPAVLFHPNHAVALTEAVYASDAPAETMTRLSRLAGRPAEPDPLGGYRIPLLRGCVRILPRAAASALFPGTPVPGTARAPGLIGLTIAVETTAEIPQGNDAVVHAGGVAIRFTPVHAG